MLKTQQLLHRLAKKSKGLYDPLDRLSKHYGINLTRNPNDSRVILSYDQMDSKKHKYSPVVRECRGLVLEDQTYNLCAFGMSRFFNYMESREEFNKFNWNDFVVETKEDGSLILVYYWNGEWRINTRGSFGLGVANGKNTILEEKTWRQLVLEILPLDTIEKLLNKHETHIFELCSLWNKNVRHYSTPMLSLLTSRNNIHLKECGDIWLDNLANDLGVQRPKRYNFNSIEECEKFLETCNDPTFEGFVLKDGNFNRIKLKSKKYILLHKQFNNGNLLNIENLFPFIIDGEEDEIITIWPELKERILNLKEKFENFKNTTLEYWNKYKNIENQKEYALKVKSFIYPALLFELRKGKDLKEILSKYSEKIVSLI